MSYPYRRNGALSQHFLTSGRLVDHLIDLSSLGAADVVYEIGPGRGLITERLAQRCRRVVAVEKDACLAALLRRRFGAAPSVVIRHDDFLRVALPGTPYKVFANIPFNVTTAIVTKLTSAPCPPDDAYLVVQREAAAKFTGAPRGSLYAALLQPWFEPVVVYRFQRTDFSPPPSVETVMLRLHKRGPPLIGRADARLYRDFVTYCFTARQPALRFTLRRIFSPRQMRCLAGQLGVDLNGTPTTVCVEQWLALFEYYKGVSTTEMRKAIVGTEDRLKGQQARLHKVHRTRHVLNYGQS